MSESDQKWTVEHWMTDIALAIAPHTAADAAMFKMHIGGFRHLPVVDGGKLVGIISDRDLIGEKLTSEAEMASAYFDLSSCPTVGDLMTPDPATTSRTDPLDIAVSQLLEHKYSALPVTDDNRHLVGILTTHDVLRACQEALATLHDFA
jgi:acetoin utilization protein AcuB